MAKFSFPKIFKVNYNFSPVLHNRAILYFFLFLVIIEVVYFIGARDIASLVILLSVGFLTTFFNKNMIIVLFLALVITNVLKYGIGSRLNESFVDYQSKEGFEGKDDTKDDKTEDKMEDDKTGDKESSMKGKDSEETDNKEKIDEQYQNLKEEYLVIT